MASAAWRAKSDVRCFRITDLEDLLQQRGRVLQLVHEEAQEVAQKFGTPRRTVIAEIGSAIQLSDEDLIPNQPSLILFSRRGYIKRMPGNTFAVQNRGGKGKQLTQPVLPVSMCSLGLACLTQVRTCRQHASCCKPGQRYLLCVAVLVYQQRNRNQWRELLSCLLGDAGQIGAKLKGNDVVEDVLHVMDHDHVLFFTADGVARSIRAHQIPLASRTALGTAITQVGAANFIPVSACCNLGGHARLTLRQWRTALCGGVPSTTCCCFQACASWAKSSLRRGLPAAMSGCNQLCAARTAALPALAPPIVCPERSLLVLCRQHLHRWWTVLVLVQVLPIKKDDVIAAMLPVSDFLKDKFLVLCTEKGVVKKTPLSAFADVRSSGIAAIKLRVGT